MTPLSFPSACRLIDLSMPLGSQTPVYPGDPPVLRSWHCTLARDGFNLSRLELGAHAGAHVDAPLHFLGEGSDIAALPLASFFGPAIAIPAPKAPGEDVGLPDLEAFLRSSSEPVRAGDRIRPGDIVLFHTGWDAGAGTPAYFSDPWPGFTPELVDHLIALGVKAIGGDLPSADGPAALAAGAPAHTRLAAANIPIFECLTNLHEVSGQRFLFAGFPLKITEAEASPIRAVAIVE